MKLQTKVQGTEWLNLKHVRTHASDWECHLHSLDLVTGFPSAWGKLETHMLGRLRPAALPQLSIQLSGILSSSSLHARYVSPRREQSWTGPLTPLSSLGSQRLPTNDSHASAAWDPGQRARQKRSKNVFSSHLTRNTDGLPCKSHPPQALPRRDVAGPLPSASLTLSGEAKASRGVPRT